MSNTETFSVRKTAFIDEIYMTNLDISQHPIGSEWSLVLGPNDQVEKHPELGHLLSYVIERLYSLKSYIRNTNLSTDGGKAKMTLVKTGKEELTFFSTLREGNLATFGDTPLAVRLSLREALPTTPLGNKTELVSISQPDSYNEHERNKFFSKLPVGASFDLATLGHRLLKLLIEIREKQRSVYDTIVSKKTEFGLNKAIVMTIGAKPSLVLYCVENKGGAKLVLSELDEQSEDYPGYVADVVSGAISETIIPNDDILVYSTCRTLSFQTRGLMASRKVFGKVVFDVLSDFLCKPSELLYGERISYTMVEETVDLLETLLSSRYARYLNRSAELVITSANKVIPSGLTGKEFSELLGIDPVFVNRIFCVNSCHICGKEYDGSLLTKEEFDRLVLEECTASLILTRLGKERTIRNFNSGIDAIGFFKEVILRKAPDDSSCEIHENNDTGIVLINLVKKKGFKSETLARLILNYVK